MWRKVVVLLVGLLLVLPLAGGIGAQGNDFVTTFSLPMSPPDEGPLAGVDPAGQVITYWHNRTGDHETLLNQMVAEFNTQNPWGITVEASNQGGYGDIYQKVIAGIAGGELPNLVVAFQGQAATYQLDGALVDIDVFVHDGQWGFNDAEQADFFQGFFLHDLSPQFAMRLGFPLRRSVEVMYVNLDALAELGYDAPPTSWAALGEMACAWSASAANRVGFSIPGDVSFIAAATFGLGGDIFDYEHNEYTYDNPATIFLVEFLQQQLAGGCVNQTAESGGDRMDFANGVNLFYFGSSGSIPFVRAALAESEHDAFAWTVAPHPYTDLGAAQPTLKLNGASVSIPQTTPEQELAAWLFVRWFTEPAQQARWAQVTNFFPVRASAAEQMADFLAGDAQYAAAFALLEHTHTVPTVAGYDVAREMLGEAFYAMLDGEDVSETLAALTEQVNDVYLTQFQQ